MQYAPITETPFSVEKREVELQKMLATVMKDKEKIEETIDELDRYKRDALQKTWEKVDGQVQIFDAKDRVTHCCCF